MTNEDEETIEVLGETRGIEGKSEVLGTALLHYPLRQ